MLKHFFAPLAGPVLLVPLALAQGGSPIEAELELESVTVVSPHLDMDADTDAETLLGELSITGNAEKVLENGVRLRARGALRLQADHSSRPGGIGGFGDALSAPVGAFSGLSSGTPIESSDIWGRLETAYLQIDGGYGELRVGKNRGVAARFYEGPKSALSHARLDTALLDPSGLSTLRTRHDLTGPSPKLSYASPRILGLRGGISFTPEADADGLDRRPSSGTGGVSPEIENAIELALNGTRRLRESGWRFDVGLGWSTADVSTNGPQNIYGSVETWSAGTRIEQGDWTFGASWLNSDNGQPASDYSAWSAGLFREAYNIDFSAEFGESKDDGAVLNSKGWRLAAGKDFGKDTRIAVAYLHDELTTPLHKWTAQGVVVEITLSQEIVQVTGN